MPGIENIGSIEFEGEKINVDAIRGFNNNLEIAVYYKDTDNILLSGVLKRKINKNTDQIIFYPDVSKKRYITSNNKGVNDPDDDGEGYSHLDQEESENDNDEDEDEEDGEEKIDPKSIA